MTTSQLQGIACQVQAEHRRLARFIRTIQMVLQHPPPADQRAAALEYLRNMLHELHEHLERHFATEEQEGVIDDAVARLPRLAPEADRIVAEHQSLLPELAGVIRFVEGNYATGVGWQELATRFEAFARRIRLHEAAENRLLQRGFNDDLGLEED